MDILTGLGLAIPAGLNAYIPLLTVAVAQQFGWIRLEEPYSLLGEWWAIALIAVLLVIEVVADKVPVVDTVNDTIQTIVRPAAGGLMFAASTAGGDYLHPVVFVVAGVLVAGGVHAAKATARPVVNATTGGAGGPAVSTVEDIAALAMTVLAILVPVIAVAAALVVAVLVVRRLRRSAATPSSGAR